MPLLDVSFVERRRRGGRGGEDGDEEEEGKERWEGGRERKKGTYQYPYCEQQSPKPDFRHVWPDRPPQEPSREMRAPTATPTADAKKRRVAFMLGNRSQAKERVTSVEVRSVTPWKRAKRRRGKYRGTKHLYGSYLLSTSRYTIETPILNSDHGQFYS